jgi:Flp pilus assembly protein TadG
MRSARRRGRQSGAVTAELVVATPLLLLLISLIVQYALFEHAEHVAQSAAQEAVTVTRLQGGTIAAGQQEGDDVLSTLNNGLLVNPAVSITRTNTQARVEVSGYAEQLVPFLRISVDAIAVAPVEPPAAGP